MRNSNFHLQKEMNSVVWEYGGLSHSIVPGKWLKCYVNRFLGLCTDKRPSDHISEKLPILLTFIVVVVVNATTTQSYFSCSATQNNHNIFAER